MALTLSEKIVASVGIGEDPTELVNLAAQSSVLGSLTASAAELNVLDGIAATLTAAELSILDGVTATAAEINAAADISSFTQLVAGAGGAVTLGAAGGTILVPLLTSNLTATLPATPTLGLRYDFIYIGTATDAEDWVLTAAAFFSGGLAWNTHGTPDIEPVYGDGTTHNTLTVNNPAAGTVVTVIGNGTTWAVSGTAVAANTPAFSAV